MVELYEDEISTWYWNLPDTNLTDWLCVERVLDEGEDDCLNETMPHKDEKNETQIEGKDEKAENEMKSGENKNKKDEAEEGKKEGEKKEKKGRKEEKNPKTSEPERREDDEDEDEDRDSEKIQRLIRQQAEEQARDRYHHGRYRRNNRHGSGGMDEKKRKKLRDRLLAIRDAGRLRRELRKIRQKELTEDEYVPPEPWEDRIDHQIPEEVRRDMRRRRYERLVDVEDFQRELEMRALDLERDDREFYENFAITETLHFYLEEARSIRDKEELRKRIQDLDALAAILADGRGRHHDEL